MLTHIDKQRLLDFYNHSLYLYGPDSEKALHWLEPEDQTKRFETLCKVGNLEAATILDAGCGVGDLFGFISNHVTSFNYLGIDIVPEMVKQARLKYPAGYFWSEDIFDIQDTKFDYVLASGTMSFHVSGGRNFYYEMIKHLFNLADKALAFNMLNSALHHTDEDYLSYDQKEVGEVIKDLTPTYQLITGYEPGDFTIYMYK